MQLFSLGLSQLRLVTGLSVRFRAGFDRSGWALDLGTFRRGSLDVDRFDDVFSFFLILIHATGQ